MLEQGWAGRVRELPTVRGKRGGMYRYMVVFLHNLWDVFVCIGKGVTCIPFPYGPEPLFAFRTVRRLTKVVLVQGDRTNIKTCG